ncbi:unnamed protein product [Urochloa humidicola]
MGITSSTSAAGGHHNTNTSPAMIGETVTGSLILHIPRYSATMGIGVGRSINSGTFTAGGHSWHVAYYPDGERDDCADWISVFLYLDQPAAATDGIVSIVDFRFSICDRNGALVYGKFNPVVATISCANGSARRLGYRRFLKKWKLESWWWKYLQLGGEGFQIRCDISMVNRNSWLPEEAATAAVAAPVVVPPPASW